MEQFNPCLRNFVAMAKTYEKALSSEYPPSLSLSLYLALSTPLLSAPPPPFSSLLLIINPSSPSLLQVMEWCAASTLFVFVY